MTISRNNCGSDSRVVKALVEQVSQIQEDLYNVNANIVSLDKTKADKNYINALDVNTLNLSATSATIGGMTTINENRLNTSNLSSTFLFSNNADFNYVHSNVGYIENLSTDALTVNGAVNAFDINTKRVKVTETIKVPSLSADRVNANTLSVNGNVNALGVTADSANYNVVNLQTLNVSQSLNVRNLNITGNISGLNNVDIVANSITTPTIDAKEMGVGAIYTTETSGDYHLVPTPLLSNYEHFTIQLPKFTGTVVLKWVDGHSNEVWSATVIGDGKDYEIHWGTVGETMVVQKIYQYDGSLYIRHNANGSLYYSYHTTEKLDEITIWKNYVKLDNIVWEDYTHDCTTLSGTVSFSNFYAPCITMDGTRVFYDVVINNSLTVNKLSSLNSLSVEAKSINWNGTDVKVCNNFDTTWVKD